MVVIGSSVSFQFFWNYCCICKLFATGDAQWNRTPWITSPLIWNFHCKHGIFLCPLLHWEDCNSSSLTLPELCVSPGPESSSFICHLVFSTKKYENFIIQFTSNLTNPRFCNVHNSNAAGGAAVPLGVKIPALQWQFPPTFQLQELTSSAYRRPLHPIQPKPIINRLRYLASEIQNGLNDVNMVPLHTAEIANVAAWWLARRVKFKNRCLFQARYVAEPVATSRGTEYFHGTLDWIFPRNTGLRNPDLKHVFLF
jgi:hypothetical protein